ncbi:hypothetical protein [Agrobacterium rubi]|uniref:Flagellar FliJ protein n=1 Tax=Agrobacterium rubi TaxID=28099 RepID=A0AAE7R5P8_9HYPH|nr:hypothetical protein [Agrobacterium rubi]NTE85417.1 hypothetical protein [Agrobacterium rubi]NTF01349.1 hypothetical protein [Agrobacterium rubi]NTF35592.1 hypothetical protein [Agrobacterium rubi]OCJ48480.1 hypothetical protein A6U92_09995 [Agrobacterium rubi]QTG00718.1 hypothetical protein G6M88_10075 [Agrobacterium rubi]
MDPLKSKKLSRLVKVQGHIKQMAENELAITTRERNELAEKIETLSGYVTSLDPLHQQMLKHYAMRHGRLLSRDVRLEAMEKGQEQQVVKETKKGERLEKKRDAARADELRVQEDNSVYELIDLQMSMKDTSLQQG